MAGPLVRSWPTADDLRSAARRQLGTPAVMAACWPGQPMTLAVLRLGSADRRPGGSASRGRPAVPTE